MLLLNNWLKVNLMTNKSKLKSKRIKRSRLRCHNWENFFDRYFYLQAIDQFRLNPIETVQVRSNWQRTFRYSWENACPWLGSNPFVCSFDYKSRNVWAFYIYIWWLLSIDIDSLMNIFLDDTAEYSCVHTIANLE